MKKMLAVLLSASLALSLSACSGNGANDQIKIDKVLDNVKPGTDENEMWKILPKIDVTPIENLVYEYNVEYGGMAVTGYKVQSPKVRIPDKIEGEPVVGVDLGDYTITEIIMPDTVKRAVLNKSCLQYANYPLSLETYEDLFGELSGGRSYSAPGSANEAFKGSTVEAVYIPNGVRSIPSYAFSGCRSLEKINIPITVTSLEDDCFYNCESLKSIELPDYLNYIGYAGFAEDAVITYKNKKYTAENSDELYELVNYRDGMFIRNGILIDCLDDVTKIEIPGSVTEIGSRAFDDCTKLASVTIPDSVTSLSGTYLDECTSLTDVSYKGKTYSYDTIRQLYDLMSFGESGMTIERNVLIKTAQTLTDAVIPEGVTEIAGDAFRGHESLKSVTIPGSVTKIDRETFAGCTGLSSVAIPNSMTEIAETAFDGCTSLTNVTYKGKAYNFSSIYILYDAVNLGETGMLIEDGVLMDVSRGLTEVTIPDSVNKIGDDAFDGCTGLTNITYKAKSYNYDTIDDLRDLVYYGESGLRIENNVLTAVSPRLTDVVIPDGVTEIQGAGADMFDRYYDAVYGRYSYYPPYSDSATVPAFKGCTNLVSVTIPDSVTSIGSHAFEGCTSLKSVNFPDRSKLFSPSSYDKDLSLFIGASAFEGCTSLTSITLYGTTIGKRAFADCTSLTSVKMVMNNYWISNIFVVETAFENCSNLQNVTATLGDDGKVYHTGDRPFDLYSADGYYDRVPVFSLVFSGCEKLESVRVDGDATFYDRHEGQIKYYDLPITHY